MKKGYKMKIKRFVAAFMTVVLTAGSIPFDGFITSAKGKENYSLDNGYIKVDVSGKNGGFLVSTVKGDKVNKDDNNKKLLFHNGIDDTSFTSFQVTRGNETKEYIFGGNYKGSSDVALSKKNDEISAEWTVDDITFVQKISLVNSGSSEHGMAYISYSAKNKGADATIKARVLMDTAFNYQDYAYYNIGSGESLVEFETTLGENGYNKSFYGYDDPFSPNVTSYFVNASVDNKECKPYQTIFGHWNNLAASIFDYTSDSGMNFTNSNNKEYLTADSAVALYYDMGDVKKDDSGFVALNYGVFSNEKVNNNDSAAVNVTAPDVLELNEDRVSYKDDGYFTIKTNIQNISNKNYDRVRVVVYTTSGITALNQKGEDVKATYDNPFSIDYSDFVSEQTQTTEWKFKAKPLEEGQYATVHYKVYDVSDDKTLSTNGLLAENLIGEGRAYILCPGTINEVPKIQFTGTSPDVIYSKGERNLTVTGSNFSMLMNQSEYQVRIRRMDRHPISGKDSIQIPSNNVKIDAEKNIMTLVFNDMVPGELPEGQYEVYFDYTQADKEDISAPALRFQVKDDEKYRNDAYGVLVAEMSPDSSYIYTIKEYKSEEEYQKALEEDERLQSRSLLEFRGVFTKKKSNMDDTYTYTGISLSDDDNVMTLNNCLDIKNGIVTIVQNGSGITVDFDAEILITGEGTKVWKGVCALTALENGTEFGLIPYQENGERDDFNYETITLLWPSIGQAAHNLLGMLMDFKYAELGKINHEDSQETKVVAFGAALDLSFVSNKDGELDNTTALSKVYESAVLRSTLGGNELRSINKRVPYNTDTVNTDADEDDDKAEFTGSIQIDDVLFGGKYLGVCFTVALGIPAYVEGMPEVEGELTVKTVGNWEAGVSGSCDFEMFCLEAEIGIKSNGKIVVPDKFRVFLGNIKPGINVDGMGILWLQGAGGGIDNLYDTIFLKDSVPPLKLLIEAQFSLMQVISARAALELSLRGISVELTDGEIANSITVLDKAKVQFEWYPEFYFAGSVKVNILDVISGGGYIVAEENGFFEFFIKAALLLPDSIPIVGGMEVAGAGLGANKDKLWGQLEVLGVKLGLIYYWGGSIEWGGGASASPTYPDLINMSSMTALNGHYKGDVPVYYDSDTGKTLYMHTGINMQNNTTTNTVESFGVSTPGVSGRVAKNELNTLANGKEHLLKLASKQNDEAFTLQWDAKSREDAEKEIKNIKIRDNANGEEYKIKIFDHSKTVEEQPEANANLSYDAESKKATFAITFTNSKYFDREWKITTKNVTSAILYDLEEMPEISDDTAIEKINGRNMTVSLKGSELDSYDKVIFTAIPKDTTQKTIFLYQKEFPIKEEKISFELPYDMESGSYTLRIMASDDDSNYYDSIDKDFSYTNENQPKKPAKVSAKAGGNYQINLNIEKPSGKFDGYRVNVYDKDGNIVSGLEGLMYTADGEAVRYDSDGKILTGGKAEDKLSILVGGQYTYYDESAKEDKIVGLTAGNTYVAGVSAWKTSDEGEIVCSNEFKTTELKIPEIKKTNISISGTSESVLIEANRNKSDGSKVTFTTPYYSDENLNLTVKADDKISGEWVLDGGTRKEDTGVIDNKKEITLKFENLSQGSHLLEIKGTNSNNDAVSEIYSFGIDSEGPRLLISSPISGAVYDSAGKIAIEGITDPDTKLTITDKDTGKVYIKDYEPEIDENGIFKNEISLDTDVLLTRLVIEARDTVGNVTEKEIQLVNPAMGMIKSIDMYAGNTNISNKKISSGASYELSLKANLSDGRVLDITNSELVEWNQNTISGSANLTESDGSTILKTNAGARGMLTGRFRISDAGSYSVSAIFVGNDSNEFNDETTEIVLLDKVYFTGKKTDASPKVYYNGELLAEGTDYTVYYENNVKPTTKNNKAVITVTGQGKYSGSVSKTFDIVYLESEGTYSIKADKGEADWYNDSVRIVPKDGYMISEKSQVDGYATSSIVIKKEGKSDKTLYIKRISDGAITDKIQLSVKIDKSVPTGSISLDKTTWDKFEPKLEFNKYKLKKSTLKIKSKDALSGMKSVEYAISNGTAYDTVEKLLNANLSWKEYNSKKSIILAEGKKQIVYARLTDKAGNVSYINTDGIIKDNTAPIISDVHIKEDDSLKPLQADIAFTINESGKYYYAVLPADLDAPSVEQVISGEIDGAVTGSGVIKANDAGKEIRCSVYGLHKNTSYLVYVAAEDKAININTGNKDVNRSDVVVSTKPIKTPDASTDINSDEITCEMESSVEYTGEELKPHIIIKNGEFTLNEGTDYELIWDNNINVSKDAKAKVIIKGKGDYEGERTLEFEIEYMDAENCYEIKGAQGMDGWYKDVSVVPKHGYEIILQSEITDGKQDISFRIKRTVDGALSDVVTLSIKNDSTQPTGKIKALNKEWSEFNARATILQADVNKFKLEIVAKDSTSGIQQIKYAISDQTAYKSEEELLAAGLDWKDCTVEKHVDISLEKDGIIYVLIVDKAGNTSYINSDIIKIGKSQTVVPETGKAETVETDKTEKTENTISDVLTGDNMQVFVWLAVIISSATCVIVARKRRKSN